MERMRQRKDEWKKYLEKVLQLVKKFKEANFIQIPREENVEADTLAKEASTIGAMDEFDEVQYVPSVDLPEVQQIENEENWMTPIVLYLKDRRLSEGKDEAENSGLEQPGMSLWTKFCTKKAFLNLISSV